MNVGPSHRLIAQVGCYCAASHRAAVSSSRRPLTAPPSRRLIAQAGCCVPSRRAAVSSSCRRLLHHLSLRHPLVLLSCRSLVLSLRCPLIVSSRCLVVAFLWNYVLEFEERVGGKFVADAKFHRMAQQGPGSCPSNLTRGARDDGSRCPPPPPTSNVVVDGVGLAIASPLPSPSPWMLLLALQPCCRRHRSCRRHQCPFRRPPPSPTLVTVTITITITLFVAIAITRPPPLSPPPSLLPPSPLPLRCLPHPHHRRHRPCHPHP